MATLLEGTRLPTEVAIRGGRALVSSNNKWMFRFNKMEKKMKDRIICEVKDRETEQNRTGKNVQAVLISIPIA